MIDLTAQAIILPSIRLCLLVIEAAGKVQQGSQRAHCLVGSVATENNSRSRSILTSALLTLGVSLFPNWWTRPECG
eukprot:9566707-Alexandrium_andersonii.AAC.1